MEKLNYILKRILQMIPVLIIGILLVFALVRFLPGDTATAILGDKARPEVLAAYREKMGLNDSIFKQFIVYCQSHHVIQRCNCHLTACRLVKHAQHITAFQ